MKEYNFSVPSKYYRQNNNEVNPLVSCKITESIEMLDLYNHRPDKVIIGEYKQPEDNVTAYMIKKYGRSSVEDWFLVAKAINEIYGKKVCDVFMGSFQEALQKVSTGDPLAISTKLTKGGHVVGLVGFTTEQTDGGIICLNKVREIIINDPNGDRTSGIYDVTKSGFNNRYERDVFASLYKGYGLEVYRI